MQCFAVRRGEFDERFDPHFHDPRFDVLVKSIRAAQCSPLGALVNFSSEQWSRTEEKFGQTFPYIEISAVGLQTGEYVCEAMPVTDAPSRARMVVHSRNILLSLTRPHRGAIVRVKDEHDGAIASTGFSVLVQKTPPFVDWDFLLYALWSQSVLLQFLQRSSGGSYPAITESELTKILIPTPPLPKQRKLVTVMEAARTARRTKLADADALLISLDHYLLDILKITLPPPDARRVFAIRLGTVRESRFDPDYFHPERILTVRGMKSVAERLWCPSLHEAVTFERDQITEPGENYLSLAHVQSHTGELVTANEESAGTCFTFKRDDVLFGRLRPYLNKVHRAERPGCCSPEFHVLRVKPDTALLPEYLATILRSSLILAQTRHMMTGNTHPRLANDDVVNLIIPVPDIATQTTIAAEVRRRREAARALRTKAEADWSEAKRWFEEQLLGDVK